MLLCFVDISLPPEQAIYFKWSLADLKEFLHQLEPIRSSDCAMTIPCPFAICANVLHFVPKENIYQRHRLNEFEPCD